MADGFDPRKSKVSENKTNEWNHCVLSMDLIAVPGIGPKTVELLAQPGEAAGDQITNLPMLFGKYLSLKGPDIDGEEVSVIEHNERFWHFLKAKGIKAHRSAIVKAVAEKCVTFIPDLYDPSVYDED